MSKHCNISFGRSWISFNLLFRHCVSNIPYNLIIYVTSFSSITYYSNLKLISNMLYEQRHLFYTFRHPCFHSQASSHSFLCQATRHKQNNSVVVQNWYQSVPVRSTPTPDPYPHSNRGQTLGTHWSCPPFSVTLMIWIQH